MTKKANNNKKMKNKKKKKGFTLIELLAIIVILAIIMVVTIPTVLGSLGDARQKTFNASANTVAEWFEKQYNLSITDDELIGKTSPQYISACADKEASNCKKNSKHQLSKEELNAAGVKAENYSYVTYNPDGTIKTSGKSTIYIENGRSCVTLVANSNGDFRNIKNKTSRSSGCSENDLTEDEKKEYIKETVTNVAEHIYKHYKIIEGIENGELENGIVDFLDDPENPDKKTVFFETIGVEDSDKNIEIIDIHINEDIDPRLENNICVILRAKLTGEFHVDNILDGYNVGNYSESNACH